MSSLESCERKRTWVDTPSTHIKVRHSQVNVSRVFGSRNRQTLGVCLPLSLAKVLSFKCGQRSRLKT